MKPKHLVTLDDATEDQVRDVYHYLSGEDAENTPKATAIKKLRAMGVVGVDRTDPNWLEPYPWPN